MEEIIRDLSIMALPILLAITVHELAHGWVAYKLGDNTAKLAGRLTLNPLAHLDVVGTLAFILTRMIGWAKPVPVDPRNFSNPKKDMLLVSAAGPVSNILVAGLFAVFFRTAMAGYLPLPMYVLEPLVHISLFGVKINVGLAIFNLLPIHPLDGSGVLEGLLPAPMAIQYDRIRPYGFIILIVLIMTSALDYIIYPPINHLTRFLLGVF